MQQKSCNEADNSLSLQSFYGRQPLFIRFDDAALFIEVKDLSVDFDGETPFDGSSDDFGVELLLLPPPQAPKASVRPRRDVQRILLNFIINFSFHNKRHKKLYF